MCSDDVSLSGGCCDDRWVSDLTAAGVSGCVLKERPPYFILLFYIYILFKFIHNVAYDPIMKMWDYDINNISFALSSRPSLRSSESTQQISYRLVTRSWILSPKLDQTRVVISYSQTKHEVLVVVKDFVSSALQQFVPDMNRCFISCLQSDWERMNVSCQDDVTTLDLTQMTEGDETIAQRPRHCGSVSWWQTLLKRGENVLFGKRTTQSLFLSLIIRIILTLTLNDSLPSWADTPATPRVTQSHVTRNWMNSANRHMDQLVSEEVLVSRQRLSLTMFLVPGRQISPCCSKPVTAGYTGDSFMPNVRYRRSRPSVLCVHIQRLSAQFLKDYRPTEKFLQ